MSSGALKVEPLITRRVALENYREIYDHMDDAGLASLLVYRETGSSESSGASSRVGVADGARVPSAQLSAIGDQGVLDATSNQSSVEKQSAAGSAKPAPDNRSLITDNSSHPSLATTIRVSSREIGSRALAVIGAGNFTKMTAMPALAAVKAPVKFVVSSGGVTGTSLAKKYHVPFSSTDYQAVLGDPDVRGVIITTRHNLHAGQVIAGLNAGKHVLVEKPLCLTINELAEIGAVISYQLSGSNRGNRSPLTDSRAEGATDNRQLITDNPSAGSPNNQELLTNNQASLTVGYNRRFSPHIEKMKALLGSDAGPISVIATMNAGAIPLNHWVHDPEVGGGRILGEACHFVDLAIHLTGSLIVEVSATLLEGSTDSASILLRHVNGSTSVVNYFAQGHRELSKERVEVHSQGRSLLLDNFRELRGYGFKSFSKLKTRQDKGHAKQFALFAERVKTGGPALIPWAEIDNGMRAVFAVLRAVTERRVVGVGEMK